MAVLHQELPALSNGGSWGVQLWPAGAELWESFFKFLWLVITQQFSFWVPCFPIILAHYKLGMQALLRFPPPSFPLLYRGLWLIAARGNNWEGESTCNATVERLNVTRVLNLFSESILANLFSLPSHSGPPTQGGGRLSDFINQGASPGLMNFNSKLSLTILPHLMSPGALVISSSPINQGSHKATLEFISRKQVVSSPETGFFCHFRCEEYPFLEFFWLRDTPKPAVHLPAFLRPSFISPFSDLIAFICSQVSSPLIRRLTGTKQRGKITASTTLNAQQTDHLSKQFWICCLDVDISRCLVFCFVFLTNSDLNGTAFPKKCLSPWSEGIYG